jgi:hypothetical protein
MGLARSPKGICGPLAGVLLVLPAGDAAAERRYQVEITSEPAGATIYFEDGDAARIEETPFRARLAPGNYTVIFELEGHRDEIREFRVGRSRGVQRLGAQLERLDPAYVVLEIAPAFQGAEVRIDGDQRVEAAEARAQEFLVSPGAHLVELVLEGEVVFSDWVQVDGGQRVPLKAFPEDSGADDPGPVVGGGPVDDGPKVTATADERFGPGAMIVAGAGLELGGRRFRFKNSDGNFRPYDAGVVPFARLLAELHPFGHSSSRYLAGIGFTASVAFPVVSITATTRPDNESPPEELETFTSDFEVGGLYRYYFSQDLFAGVSVHYGGQRSEFGELETSDLDEGVPGVDYRFIRFGLDAGGRAGPVMVHGGVSAQQVLDIGDLADRFENTNVVGLGARAGLSTRVLAPIELRLIGNLSHYTLKFTNRANAMDTADGGTDLLYGLMFGAVYAY